MRRVFFASSENLGVSVCPSCHIMKRHDICPTCRYQPAITSEAYFGIYASQNAAELTEQIRNNAKELLLKINRLVPVIMPMLENWSVRMNSGWRPEAHNRLIGGAPNSKHISGQAVDLNDPTGSLGRILTQKPDLLESAGLYIELPSYTPGWVHFQSIPPGSGKHIFQPYSGPPRTRVA